PAGEPPFPAVVVIQEWWGLNDHIRHWTDRLAADGYAALAVDLYDGTVATDRDGALAAMQAVKDERASEIIRAGLDFLKGDERVQASALGTIGWCFGGGWSFRAGLQNPDVKAIVMYYGRMTDDPTELAKIRGHLCGVFGNRDQGIPPDVVNAFDEGLTKAGVPHEIWRYDADHAFANPSSARYDEKSAEDAWGHVRAFLARELRPAE
ncbi:MAG: dienelactone hydrolase family protein, partial [Gemmatimonadetes bacterium]|nr:dienelactone hydrolase family protein [Gemmatimonadota bacterium]